MGFQAEMFGMWSDRSRLRVLALAAGAAVGVGSAAHGQVYSWIGTASGNFSTGSNWQGATPPPMNGLSTSLRFEGANLAAALTATNNIGTPFLVNNLTFNSYQNPALTIAGTAGSMFQLMGPSPTITLSGNNIASTSLSLTGGAIQLAGNTVIDGTGMGGITFNGAISDDFATSGIRRSLTIRGTPATLNSRVVNFAASNTFSGGLFLDGGNMAVSGFVANGAFGPAGTNFTVTSNGGALQIQGAVTPTVDRFQLDGTLRILATGNTLQMSTSQLAGSGNLVIHSNSSPGVNVGTNSASYTGEVTIDRHDLPQFAAPISGGLQLSGANGALQGVTRYNVRSGGSVIATNSTANVAANSDRINNAAEFNLASGQLRVAGVSTTTTSSSNITEVVGAVNGAGHSALAAEPVAATTRSTVLNVNGALNRTDRGTFIVRGTALGSGTLTANATLNGDGSQNFDGAAATGYVVVPGAKSAELVGGGGIAGSNNISILPYAVGDVTNTGTGTSFVTLDAITGSTARSVRPLAVSEYATDLVSGATTNARLTSSIANNGTETVNALVLAGADPNIGSITGSGTLNVTSGAILSANTSGNVSIANNVNFGLAEGVISTPGFNGLTISGSLIGSNGLTKAGGTSGNNTLFLTGDNTGLTGTLTVNSGAVNFNSAAALPGTGTIVTNGAGVGTTGMPVGLNYSGTTPLTLSRDVAANSGWVTFKALDTATGGSLTLAGQISGNAGVNLQGVVNGADIWVTGSSNTYTGPTRFGGGRIHIAGDGSLGNGGGVHMGGAQLVLEGDWTSSRHINFASGNFIDTNGHSATLTGPLTSFLGDSLNNTPPGAFSKVGLGTLTLTSFSNQITGAIAVNGGALLINGNLGASAANAVTVNTGGTLGGTGTIYRNISVTSGGNLAPGASPGILTVMGAVTLASGATLTMEIQGPAVGAGYDQLAASGLITLTGSTLAPSLSGFIPSGSTFWLINNAGAAAVTGTFAGLAEGATVTLGTLGDTTYTAQISYTGNYTTGLVDGTGNDVVLHNVVPSPASAVALGLGGLMAVRRRRRIG